MTRDEHKNIVNQLLGMATPEQQAAASELLTQLTDDYEQTLTSNETLTANNATLTANNEKLRSVNADLFLKVGVTNKQIHKTEDKSEDGNVDESQLTFDALFNEKGELI